MNRAFFILLKFSMAFRFGVLGVPDKKACTRSVFWLYDINMV